MFSLKFFSEMIIIEICVSVFVPNRKFFNSSGWYAEGVKWSSAEFEHSFEINQSIPYRPSTIKLIGDVESHRFDIYGIKINIKFSDLPPLWGIYLFIFNYVHLRRGGDCWWWESRGKGSKSIDRYMV